MRESDKKGERVIEREEREQKRERETKKDICKIIGE